MSDVERLLRYLREPEAGTLLGQDEYVRDFGSRLWLADGADSWKVERMQFYDETGFPSRDAFAAGDWKRSAELYDDLRPELISFSRQHAEHHASFRRIRVVAAAFRRMCSGKCTVCAFGPNAGRVSASSPQHVSRTWSRRPVPCRNWCPFAARRCT